MSVKMLINAQREEQVRVAIVDGTQLLDYQVELAEAGLSRGNIYRGIVANVQPSLNAAFIDIGESRHGFLPLGDVLPRAYHRRAPKDEKRPRIDQVLEKGRPILVQVTKDGSGQKGSALTTNLALAGRYLVLMPFDDVRGVSRKVEDEDLRKKVKERLAKLELGDEGVIVRTNAFDQTQTALQRDLAALRRLWKQIAAEGDEGKGPRLLYTDQDLLVQALRDYLDSAIGTVVVDSDAAFQQAEAYMKAFMPRSKTRLVRYEERVPLFTRHHVEEQIDRIYDRTVPLPGGGSIVIDGTEALTAIDVNSGRATRHGDHDETILAVNLEAAVEVARQLRLRDIGGLVVVDFIDMRRQAHQKKVEKALRDAMKPDRARWTVGHISPNGLLEINRQRLKQALKLRTHRPCADCGGVGFIASPEFSALGLLRRIEAKAATGLVQGVTIAVHPEVGDALQNHYRRELAALEEELDIDVEIITAPELSRVTQRVEWAQREGPVPPPIKARALTAVDLTFEDEDEPEEDEDEGAAAGDGSAEAAGAEGKRKRRRRRRRRKGGRNGEGEAGAADASASDGTDLPREAASEGPEEPAEPRSAEADGDAPAEGRTRSRRRRRRRRRGGGETTDVAETGGSVETSGDRTALEGDDVREGGVLEPPPFPEPAEPEPPSASSEVDVDGDGDEAPPRRSRRRRRSRRGRGGAGEAPPDGDAPPLEPPAWDEGPALEAGPEISGEDAGVPEPDDLETAPPRARARRGGRRRRRATPEPDTTDADVAGPTPEAEAAPEATSEAPLAEGGWNWLLPPARDDE